MNNVHFSVVLKESRKILSLLARLQCTKKESARLSPGKRHAFIRLKQLIGSQEELIGSLESGSTFQEVKVIGSILTNQRRLLSLLSDQYDSETISVFFLSDDSDDGFSSDIPPGNGEAIDHLGSAFSQYEKVLVEYSLKFLPIAFSQTQDEHDSLRTTIRGYSDKLETLFSKDESKGLELEEFKQNIEKLFDELKNQNKTISKESTTLTEKINSVELRNLELINHESFELRKQLEEIHTLSSQEAHSMMVSSITEFEKRTSEKVKALQGKIQTITDSWHQKSEDAQKTIQSSIETNVKELFEKLDSLDQTLQQGIRKEVASFANQKNKLTSILGTLSEFRRSKSDIDQAEREGKTANMFRWIGLGLMFLPMVCFIAFFVGVDDAKAGVSSLVFTFPDDPSGYFLRFLTVVLFSTPSVYLLKESAYHRKQERHYRERGLQLASIGPFLDDYTPEQRVQAKNKLMDSFYCKNDGKADVSNVPDLVKQIKDVATISKSISKIAPQEATPQKIQDSQIHVETERSNINGSEMNHSQVKPDENRTNGKG